ncbi:MULTISPECIES: MFS transporter [unclassified Pseudomonas]|uniref:MFS transporter n=1 Tax=unclassified Pseudomonas TaxID=196821 RepID=UPI000BCE7CBB|nr:MULTISPECIES: MFS transporter [unclassified Pseudomonas]PVZ10520.1 sugar phosphate permease [Pseudomonas sp. URIL14HWK12:I12]PVZ21946.1 sugar phosphate permease [Pseudomonas sp. URIL14HWK12:I10]PVZ30971.1 sugar phosphate permease [Pseudomonas sp. URIL14HWK12:I11]SNZ17446.1 Sugar phosphate permease [Pseudomonas sp. URIL14HWK12:I9]
MITARDSADTGIQTVTDEQFANRTFARVKWKILPLLMICYVLALIDRNVIGFAKLGFMKDLGFGETVFGIGAGVFFVGYILFEIPSNLMLQRIGFRKTALRIMLMWGLACAAFSLMHNEMVFYVLRFILGVAEAGFFPGVLLFLTLWIPRNRRASVTAMFMAAIPISGMIGGPLAGGIMQHLDGFYGFKGWQILFLVAGLPACVMGVVTYLVLDNSPKEAKWLSDRERAVISDELAADEGSGASEHHSLLGALKDKRVYILAFTALAVFSGAVAAAFWVPTIIRKTGVSDLFHVGLLSSLPFLVGMIAQYLVGRHSDKVMERRWHVAICLGISALGWLTLALLQPSTTVSVVLLVVATASVLGATGPFWTLPGSLLTGKAAAGSIALVTTLAGVGNVFMPALVGALIDLTGSMAASQVAYGVLMLAGAAAIVMGTPPEAGRPVARAQ